MRVHERNFKTHILNDWKVFAALLKIKEEVFKNPNTNRVVRVDSHNISNDGVNKTGGQDEYYTWNEKVLYWDYYYDYDSGSGG